MHTADWHLGDKANGVNRIEEQRKIAAEIICIAKDRNVDVVVISGDVYNSANPSSEAEELFFETVEKLSDGGKRVVFAISGNHDDPDRLQAARGLANTHNIVLTGELDLTGKTFKSNSDVKVVETGYGYLKISKGNEKLTLAFLPYANNVRMNDVGKDLSYAEKVEKWIESGVSHFDDDSFNMLALHLFVAGSKIKGKEVHVGGMMAVPHNICPQCDYVAAGHMHTNQKVGNNVYYSGSTIRRHVINSEPSLNILSVEDARLVNLEVVKLKSPVVFTRIVVSGIDEAERELEKFTSEDIVEVVFKTNDPMSSSALKELKKQYKCIRNVAFELEAINTIGDSKKLKELSSEELFTRFYLKQKGTEPKRELIEYFLECGGDHNETN